MIRTLLLLVTGPVIYFQIFPLLFLDVCLTAYQYLCFPIYRIQIVRRSDHIIIDRQHIWFLSKFEKFNCIYCGYGNGVLAYASEIAARTEAFWCPLKHENGQREGLADRWDEETFRRLYRGGE